MSVSNQSAAIEGTPELPDVQQHLVKPNAPVIGTIVSNEVCTKSKKAARFVRHIEIDVSGTPLENAWVSGQSFGVIPEGLTEQGNPHKLRLYSIAAPASGENGNGKVISTTLKRVVDEHWDDHTLFTGVCSNYLADCQIGDKVQLTGPVGKRFLLPKDPSAHNYIFIATGTGIAPFRSMLGDLTRLGMPSRVDLIMGSPYESDLLYDDELRELAEDYPNRFFYRTAISRHRVPNQNGMYYVQGRILEDASVLTEILKSDRTLIYICGIAGMELGVFQSLAAILDPASLAQYLTIDPEISADPKAWERKMISRQIKHTKRLFLEVY